MFRAQTKMERARINTGVLRCAEGRRQAVVVVGLMSLFVAGATITPQSVVAQAKKPSLPYVTIDHPQFIPASEATFLSPHDILLGVTDGKTAKAYPAAILAQHGVVQDQMADGPIAVTW
jgi:Protein of unknown function (DUF3179)